MSRTPPLTVSFRTFVDVVRVMVAVRVAKSERRLLEDEQGPEPSSSTSSIPNVCAPSTGPAVPFRCSADLRALCAALLRRSRSRSARRWASRPIAARTSRGRRFR